MAEWTLADATQIRASLTKEQENEISMLYRRVYLQVRKQMLSIPKDGTTSQQIQRQYLDRLHKQLDEAYKSLGVGLEKQIEKEAKKAAQGVVDDSTDFFSKAGLTIEGAHSFVPKDIVNALVTGQVYGGNWSLSGAIWSDIDKKQSDISRIIAEGVAANKSAYDIAKDLETYVDPKAKKEWDWSKVYPGTSKKVDYNAQRLARTLISHAYQQSLERVCKNNPFVDGFIWQSAHSSRVCPICASRDGQFYKKGELPLDHPNGMCTFIASIQGSMNDVADRLANWVQGNSDPELDKWASDLGIAPVPSEKLMKRGYASLSEDDYLEWQKKNSTLSKIRSEFEKKYGVTLVEGALPNSQDRFIEEEGEWLYDILKKWLDDYDMVTNNIANRYSYVQNADWSKNINQYWRTGDSSFLVDFHHKGRVNAKKAAQLAQESLSGIKRTSKALDSIIASTKLDRDLTVDRWGGINSLKSLGISTDLSTGRVGHAFVTNGLDLNSIKEQVDSMIGTVMTDDGYMSASVSSSLNIFQGSDIKFSINVPKGTNAFITENTSESEVVFGRGTKTEIVGSRIIETEAVDTWTGEKVKTKTLEIIMNLVP